MTRYLHAKLLVVASVLICSQLAMAAQSDKPNILVIWGDKDEFLPGNHGFDEFFGNLYHLNAEEEPAFQKRYGPAA